MPDSSTPDINSGRTLFEVKLEQLTAAMAALPRFNRDLGTSARQGERADVHAAYILQRDLKKLAEVGEQTRRVKALYATPDWKNLQRLRRHSEHGIKQHRKNSKEAYDRKCDEDPGFRARRAEAARERRRDAWWHENAIDLARVVRRHGLTKDMHPDVVVALSRPNRFPNEVERRYNFLRCVAYMFDWNPKEKESQDRMTQLMNAAGVKTWKDSSLPSIWAAVKDETQPMRELLEQV